MNLLLIEDELRTAKEVAAGLERAGFTVMHAATGEDGLRQLLAGPIDALIVDVMLPGFTGFEVVRAIRDRGLTLPVLFLSALDATADRVKGLDVGGDDYLVKPFALPELVARMRALLRRAGDNRPPVPTDTVQIADLHWDAAQRRIERQGKRVDLTPKEYALAALLLEHHGEVVTRAQICRIVWDLAFEPAANTVDVQVRRLRTKLDDPYPTKLLHTLRGVGYVLEARQG